MRPGGRGGKRSHAFGDHEGITAECDGYMVVPAAESTPLEVVEAELPFQLLVDLFGAIAFLEQPNDLFFRAFEPEAS